MIFAGRKPISYSDENALIGYPTFYSNIAEFKLTFCFRLCFFLVGQFFSMSKNVLKVS